MHTTAFRDGKSWWGFFIVSRHEYGSDTEAMDMREAIVSLTDEEIAHLGFGELVAEVRDAGIRDLQMLEDDGFTCTPQVTVAEPLDTNLLDTLECIDGWELVADTDDSFVYLLELTAINLPEEIEIDFDDVIGTSTPEILERGILLSFVGTQEAIRTVLRHYEAAGASPDLHKLAEYQGDDSPVDALTDRQLEVIRKAYDMGFYEIPRETTTAEIAAELDLEPTTVSEHLQRAERNLLTRQLVT